jgi:heat shock protein HslJ
MKKTVLAVLGTSVLVVLLVALAGMYKFNYLASQPGYDVDGNKTDTALSTSDYKNATYLIGGKDIILVDGYVEEETAPESSSKIITEYFGNEVRTDLNNDGREDVVFLLTQSTGGGGTFFYAVAALHTDAGWVGSDAYLLGDRIAPQTTEVSKNPTHQNVIVVNYADRAEGEPMTAEPSEGKSVYLKLDPDSMRWGEVQADFEGEADPNVMTLEMKSWAWVRTQYNNDTILTPDQSDAFTLTFREDNSVVVTTDCNSVNGTYEVIDNRLEFKDMAATEMFCAGSQEQEFVSMLSNIHSYFFTSRGELVFDLKYDSGSSIFR